MNRKKEIILLLLILTIASFFRLWHLNSIPPGLYPDVAMNGNNAIEAMKTGDYKIFYPENNGREGLFINLQALSLKIFGIHIWSLKIVAALIGILTVLGLYLLTKELFLKNHNSKIIALLSALFLATSFWHVNFSRIGFRAIMVPFCLVWSFYFLFKIINTDSENKKTNILLAILYPLLAGFFFGLGFHTYIAFRIAVIILIVPIIWMILNFLKKGGLKNISLWINIYFKKRYWQYDLWILAIILTALPIGLYFLHNPQDFMGRAGGVSVFSQPNPIKSVISSTIKTLGMFNIRGDFNWRHNFSGSPELLWPIGILFLVGIIFSLKKLLKSKKEKNWSLFTVYCFLFVWFIAMLLPEILTYEGIPHALRAIGVIPVAYIFAGFGAYLVYKFLYRFVELKKLKKSLLLVACFLFLFACGYAEYNKYFINWANQPDVKAAFAQNYVDIGNYLNALPPEINKYIIVNHGGVLVNNIPIPAQTIIFVENSKRKTQSAKYLLPEELDEIMPATKLVVIPLQYDRQIFQTLKTKFPEGKIELYESFGVFKNGSF